MQNSQLKPAYNLQIATSSHFITSYQFFQKLTATLQQNGTLDATIMAKAGYGSESNYRFLEDNLSEQMALVLYVTMVKENSRKWKSDDRKVMNWDYHEVDDYYIDNNGVHFNLNA